MQKKVKPKKAKAKVSNRPKAKKVYGLKKSLDHRELKYASELLSGKTVVQAALSAGYTKNTAEAKAYSWVGESRQASVKPLLFDYIEAKRQQLAAKYDLTRERIIQELGKMAFTSVKDLYNENGQLKAIHEMTDAEANLIAGFEMEEVSISKNVTSVTKKVKLLKKTEVIAIANRMMGFNAPDKHVHDLGPSFLDVLMQASAKKE